jgi:hypothetical protein
MGAECSTHTYRLNANIMWSGNRKKEFTWRPRCRWEGNVKMDFEGTGCSGFKWLQWWAFVSTVMDLGFHKRSGFF